MRAKRTDGQAVKKPFIIGIDGGRKTGVAVYCVKSEKFQSIQTLDFWKAHDLILENFSPEVCDIVIETLNERGALYARSAASTQKGRETMAMKVGSVRRETSLLVERFENKGYSVRRVKPVRSAKWTAEQLARFTGWVGRTSEHGRDAARIIFHG